MKKRTFDNPHEAILTKSQANRLRTMDRFTSHDNDRPLIESILTHGDIQTATNGFQIMAVKSPEAWPDFLQGIHSVQLEGRIVQSQEFDGNATFPDIRAIMPKAEPVIEIALNPRLMIESLQAMLGGKIVLLRIFSPVQPVELIGIQNEETEKPDAWSLVMPMQKGDEKRWSRPTWLDETIPSKSEVTSADLD